MFGLAKKDLGVHVFNDFIVAYVQYGHIIKAHISKLDGDYVGVLQDSNFLKLQKDVNVKIKQLRGKRK